MLSRLLAAGSGLALLSACTSVQIPAAPLPQAGSLDAGFGEVSKYNAALQTIDPEPVYATTGAQPGDHGEKAANAAKRYRTDQVKDTEPASVSSQGGTGSGSGPR